MTTFVKGTLPLSKYVVKLIYLIYLSILMSLLSSNLEAFLAVYEATTVSGAALKIGIGQTAITERIRSLERELGISLFTRSRKGMLLTQEGKSLLKYCLNARELAGETLAEIKNGGLDRDIELRIAGPTSYISGRAIPHCQDLYARWPRMNLQFIVDDSENRINLLKQGLADIVVLYPHQVPLEADSKLIKPDEYYLLSHPSWENRDLKEILESERLFAFHAEDSTSLNYLKEYDLLKFLKRPRLFINENLGLSTLLRYGVGFGLLTKEISKPFLDTKSLIKLNHGKSLKDPLALSWYPRTNMPIYFKQVIAALK